MMEAIGMPTISIATVNNNLAEALRDLLQPFEEAVAVEGTTVLIKPNLVEPLEYTTGQTTNPALVDAIIGWCRQRGAADIAVGEGPSYFQPASALRQCFVRTGIAEVAERRGVEWIVFDEHPMRSFSGCSPDMPERFALSEHAFTWDRIINVPVPKAHYLTTVSIAMKNVKGFIRRDDKPSFHYCGRHGIHGSVTALNRLIRPALNVVDCTAPVHRNAGFLLAGTDIVATDAVTASLMGIDPRTVETIVRGCAAGLGEKDLNLIDIVGDDCRKVAINLEQPADYVQRTFPLLRLHVQHACSGCLIPLFAALRRMGDMGMGVTVEMHIASGPDALPADAPAALRIGRCSGAVRGESACLPGCPPTKEDLFDFLAQHVTDRHGR
jgi:uncharacterized protein (DUF362 family)